jgi:hypothetical protein
MSEKNEERTRPAAASTGADTDAALQEELRREMSEGDGSIGDTASNRNLTGSSTWQTLPDQPVDGADATGSQ